MSLTLPDIYDRLRQMDEEDLLDILKIRSDHIVDRFQDVIEDSFDSLQELLNWDETDDC